MTPETQKEVLKIMNDIKIKADFIKTLNLDQFTLMRLSLIWSLSDNIIKHLEV